MDEAYSSIEHAPLPTPETLKGRQNIYIQFVRFLAINLKMFRIIFKGHK